jgi:sarcosine oxidase
MVTPRYDAIVVGLGAVGSATLMQLARRGVRVLGIDRFDPPHNLGSSHGESRMSRCAIGEGGHYVPLVLRSHEIWRELEAITGETLLVQNGVLILAPREGGGEHHGKGDFLGATIASARAHGISHEVLAGDEVHRRFPQFRTTEADIGYWEPDGGFVRPERCIAAQLQVARQHGAEIMTSTAVSAIMPEAGGASVVAGRQTIACGQVVLTAGAWTPGLAPDAAARGRVAVYRQVLHWFDLDDPAAYAPDRFPTFIWMYGAASDDYFYGAPIPPGSTGLKVATEQYDVTSDPDALDRAVPPEEARAMFDRHLTGRLAGLRSASLRSTACMYTVTPGSAFIVDAAGSPHVTFVSACSGHGFKHSAALGEALARRVVQEAGGPDLSAFALERLPAAP